MGKKLLNALKQMGLGAGIILAMPLLLAEMGQSTPFSRSANPSSILSQRWVASEANLLEGVELESNELRRNSLPAAGVEAEMPTTANTANFVSQPVLDAASQLSSSTVPTLPGLGYADRFLPAQDAFAPLRLVLKLSERRVYIYKKEQVKTSFPVAIGRSGWETPTGKYTVIQMQHNPVWQHPFTGELVPPGSDNPLGARWIGFWTDGTNYIGFHGTPNEESVGQSASHGCVRMYNQDVIQLFEMVRIGTTVEVVP